MNIVNFDRRMRESGWVLLREIVPQDLVLRMIIDLEIAYKQCRNYQEKNKVTDQTDSTAHHLVGQGVSFLDFLDAHFTDIYLERHFSGSYILNSFGAALNRKNCLNYAHNIHRDVRTYSSQFPLIINTLVMLDDFTEENGATLLLSGSHHLEEKPSEEYFLEHAEPVTGRAGSILIFDSNVWHAAGVNRSDKVRRSVTPMYSRPFVKPQFDYPRALGYHNGDSFSEKTRQVLGYNSRIPETLDEWYQNPETRMYKRNQG